MLQHIIPSFKSRLPATKEERSVTKRKCATRFRVKFVVFVWRDFVVFVSFCDAFWFLFWLQITMKKSLNEINYMLQEHNVQFVVMLGKTFGLGRAAPS